MKTADYESDCRKVTGLAGKMATCPEELTDEEKKLLASHMASCKDCQAGWSTMEHHFSG